jgi:hypothetical protein
MFGTNGQGLAVRLLLVLFMGWLALGTSSLVFAQSTPCNITGSTLPCPVHHIDRSGTQNIPQDNRMNGNRIADPFVIYCVNHRLQIYKINEQSQGKLINDTPLSDLRIMNAAGSTRDLGKGFTAGRSNDSLTLVGPDQFRLDFSLSVCLQRGGLDIAPPSEPDFNRDGVADIVKAGSFGQAPYIKVYDGKTGKLLLDFLAYDPSFNGGVNVAVGDLTGDGIPDIVTGVWTGAPSFVKAFDGKSGQLFHAFLAFDPSYVGGVTVSIGNVNGDAQNDIIVKAQIQGHLATKAFDGKTLAVLLSL